LRFLDVGIKKDNLINLKKTKRITALLVIDHATKRIKEFREDHRVVWTDKNGFVNDTS